MCLYRVLCCKVCCILFEEVFYIFTHRISVYTFILLFQASPRRGLLREQKVRQTSRFSHVAPLLHVTSCHTLVICRWQPTQVFSVFLYVLQVQDLCKGDSVSMGSKHHVTSCHTLVICRWQPTQVFSVFLYVLQVQDLCKGDSVSVGSKHHRCWTFVVAVKHLNSLPVWVIQ